MQPAASRKKMQMLQDPAAEEGNDSDSDDDHDGKDDKNNGDSLDKLVATFQDDSIVPDTDALKGEPDDFMDPEIFRMNNFLNDMEKSMKVFLSSYFRD